jgi:hypothetical protein
VEELWIQHDRIKVSLGEALSIGATLLFRDSFLNEPCALMSVFAVTDVTLKFAVVEIFIVLQAAVCCLFNNMSKSDWNM